MKKRIHGLICLLLSVVMSLCMFPSTVFAVDGNGDGSIHRHFGY